MHLFSACFSPRQQPVLAANQLIEAPEASPQATTDASNPGPKRVKFQLPESPGITASHAALPPAEPMQAVGEPTSCSYSVAANATHAQGHTLLLLDMDGQHMVWSNCSLSQASIQGNHHLACFTSTAEQGVLASLLGSENMAEAVLHEVSVHGYWKGNVTNLVADALLATHAAQQGGPHDSYAYASDEAAMLQAPSFTYPLSFSQSSTSGQLSHPENSVSTGLSLGLTGLIRVPSTSGEPRQGRRLLTSVSTQALRGRASKKVRNCIIQDSEDLGPTQQSVSSANAAADLDPRQFQGSVHKQSSLQADGEAVSSVSRSPARSVRRSKSTHLRTQSVSKELMQVVSGCSQGPSSQHNYSRFTTLLTSLQSQQAKDGHVDAERGEQQPPLSESGSPQSKTKSLARKLKSSTPTRSKLPSMNSTFDSIAGFPLGQGNEPGTDQSEGVVRPQTMPNACGFNTSGRLSPGPITADLARDSSDLQPGPKTSAMFQSLGFELSGRLSTKSRASLTTHTPSATSTRLFAPPSPLHKALQSNNTERSTLPDIFGSQNGYGSEVSTIGNEVMVDQLLLGHSTSIGAGPSSHVSSAPRVPSARTVSAQLACKEEPETARGLLASRPSPSQMSGLLDKQAVDEEEPCRPQSQSAVHQHLMEEVPPLADSYVEPDFTRLRVPRCHETAMLQNDSHSARSSFDHPMLAKSERAVEMLVRVVPYELLPPGSSPLLFVSCTDVTARRAAEQLLMQLTENQLGMVSQMFPLHIIEHLSLPQQEQQDLGLLARQHHDVTILFMDIVDFTGMSKEVEPGVVMSYLNEVFSLLDEVITSHGLHKVETAGDCYIVSGGVLEMGAGGFLQIAETHDPAANARAILACAKDMLHVTHQVPMPHNGSPTQIRIGIHTGDCTSGLIGSRLPKWSLYGDCVNTASRMESTSLPGRIQVTQDTHRLLPEESWQATGGVYVKGKGTMNTYLWVPSTAAEQHLLYPRALYGLIPVTALEAIEEACSDSLASDTRLLPVSSGRLGSVVGGYNSSSNTGEQAAYQVTDTSSNLLPVDRADQSGCMAAQPSTSSSQGRQSLPKPGSLLCVQSSSSCSVSFVDATTVQDRSSFLHAFGSKASQEVPVGSRAASIASSIRRSSQVMDSKHLSKASSWFRRSIESGEIAAARVGNSCTPLHSREMSQRDAHGGTANMTLVVLGDLQAEHSLGRVNTGQHQPSDLQARTSNAPGSHTDLIGTATCTGPQARKSALYCGPPSSSNAGVSSVVQGNSSMSAYTDVSPSNVHNSTQGLQASMDLKLMKESAGLTMDASNGVPPKLSSMASRASLNRGQLVLPVMRDGSLSGMQAMRPAGTGPAMTPAGAPQPLPFNTPLVEADAESALWAMKVRRGSAMVPSSNGGDFSLTALMNAAAWKAAKPPPPPPPPPQNVRQA